MIARFCDRQIYVLVVFLSMCVNKSNISIVRSHKCHADLVEQHVIRQLISAREYTKPVRFFASVDARKRMKPASTEDGYKPFCSVDRP